MVSPTISPDVAQAIDTSIHSLTLEKILYALIALIACLIVQKVIMRLLNRALAVSRIERSLHTFLKSLIRIVLYFVTILIVADSLDFPVTTLIAMLSVAGLAVTLAVQDSLSNLAGGILVLSAKPFVVGDVIEVLGNGGTVKDITLFYTKIETADGKTASLPNRMLSSAQMINHTVLGKRRLEVSVKLPASLDEQTVRDTLVEWTTDDARIIIGDPPRARVIGRAAGVTEYALRAWVRPEDYWPVYYDWIERAGASLGGRFGEAAQNALAMQINQTPMIGEKTR